MPAARAWGATTGDCSTASGARPISTTPVLADHLVAEGLADPARLAVRGGSAGGFTVLAVLARRDTFTAGVSYFGVSDLAAFARDTHKFESRYLDRLVGLCPLRSMAAVTASHLEGFPATASPAGPGRRGRTAGAVGGDRRRARRAGNTARIPQLRGRGSRLPGAENQLRCVTAELSFYGQVFGFAAGDAGRSPWSPDRTTAAVAAPAGETPMPLCR